MLHDYLAARWLACVPPLVSLADYECLAPPDTIAVSSDKDGSPLSAMAVWLRKVGHYTDDRTRPPRGAPVETVCEIFSK